MLPLLASFYFSFFWANTHQLGDWYGINIVLS